MEAAKRERRAVSASDAEVITASTVRPEKFGEIFDRHADTLLLFLVRRVGPADAEGLLGDVFRVAFEARSRFDPQRANARPWLYGIASNLLRRHRRSEARRLRAAVRWSAEHQWVQPGHEASVDARVALPRVADAVERLPRGEREVLLLFAWEELSYDEVASALEIKVGTVRSRLHRARGRLRELVSASGQEQMSPQETDRRRGPR